MTKKPKIEAVKAKVRVCSRPFVAFTVLLFLFASCSQPNGGNTGPGQPPAAPTGLAVTPGNQKLILDWQAVSGAGAYEVFCEETEPGAGALPKQTVYVSMATISGLMNGTTYYVRLRAANSAGTSGFSPTVSGIPALQSPTPSVIRGNGQLSVGWAAEDGITYEVWYGTNNDSGAAGKSTETITRSGGIAGTTITGLANGTSYYVWIKIGDDFGEVTAAGTLEAPPASVPGFVYVPGGTVTGSGGYALTVTVPNNPAYTNPGSSSVRKGVFVEGRTVAIDSFVMAKYETTQELWYTVQDWAINNKGYQFQHKKNNPSETDKNKPVAIVSWRDAIVWCNAYSEKEGKQPVYTYQGAVIRDSRNANAAACDGAVMDKNKSGYRLPTEVEREFAARGGDPGKQDWIYMYAGSNNADLVAWYHGNSPYTVQEVGKKGVNRLGIYDLSGNVQEWCWDWMNPFVDVTAATGVNGAAYSAAVPLANQKAFNGGGVGSNITYSCVTYRWGYTPDYADNFYSRYIGFRVVRKP